ncbi:YceI family protein [Frigidibacter sp. MR17.24]|uniref:YceI family protein n=1 Tax=Frigidibacter sp. MR17.24 TaxID=3127345 RepID=UPI003012E34D
MLIDRRFVIAAPLALLATRAAGGPRRANWALIPGQTEVKFTYSLNGAPVTGRMAALSADLEINLDRLPQSSVEVVLDAAHADAGMPFARSAMLSEAVLDAARNPTITFVSTRVAGAPSAADVDGDLTMRGTTRPVTFGGRVNSAAGVDDLSQIVVTLNGGISRANFGSTGYADLVGDRVDFTVRARLRRV